jgi:chromosomal replication initiation ATPase DnaA
MMTRQLALPLSPASPPAWGSFLTDASNAEALGFLCQPDAWPNRRLALFGPAAIGKTHLLRATADARGWPVLLGPDLRGLPDLPPGFGLALDDADCAAEERALLHLLNWCAEQGRPLLLAGRQPPARWPVRLPDLSSRLRGMTTIGIAPPSDELLAALLRRHFQTRQLRVEEAVQDWLLLRLPRTGAAMAEAAARLDRAALVAGRGVTRGLAQAALGDLLDGGYDDCMADPIGDCPPAGRLL